MTKNLKAIIVEDNREALNRLKQYLNTYCHEVMVVGESDSVKGAIELLGKQKLDLVFLDIELIDGSAFDLLERVEKPQFRVIFTTAHEEYAIKAIRHSAIDFLLKPIDPDDLIVAVQRAQVEVEKEEGVKKIKHLLKVLNEKDQEISSILLRDQYGIQLVYIKEIIRLEAHGNYTKVIQKDQDAFTATKVLKEIEALLPEEVFFRSHQSHVINLNFLLRYDNRDSDRLFLKNGDKVPLAVRRKQQLLQKLSLRS